MSEEVGEHAFDGLRDREEAEDTADHSTHFLLLLLLFEAI